MLMMMISSCALDGGKTITQKWSCLSSFYFKWTNTLLLCYEWNCVLFSKRKHSGKVFRFSISHFFIFSLINFACNVCLCSGKYPKLSLLFRYWFERWYSGKMKKSLRDHHFQFVFGLRRRRRFRLLWNRKRNCHITWLMCLPLPAHFFFFKFKFLQNLSILWQDSCLIFTSPSLHQLYISPL